MSQIGIICVSCELQMPIKRPRNVREMLIKAEQCACLCMFLSGFAFWSKNKTGPWSSWPLPASLTKIILAFRRWILQPIQRIIKRVLLKRRCFIEPQISDPRKEAIFQFGVRVWMYALVGWKEIVRITDTWSSVVATFRHSRQARAESPARRNFKRAYPWSPQYTASLSSSL